MQFITLYFWNNSLDNGALILGLRSTEVAPKWAFLIFLRDDVLLLSNFTANKKTTKKQGIRNKLNRTLRAQQYSLVIY